MPGGSQAALTQIALDQQRAEWEHKRATVDANLERVGQQALARAKMKDIAAAEAQAAADAENKAQIDEMSGGGEGDNPTDSLAELFQPVSSSTNPNVNELNAGSLLAIPRGSQGGGPQGVQPNAGGGGDAGGDVSIPDAPDYTTDTVTEQKPVETFPGIYAPMTSQRTERRQNALTPAQVIQLRMAQAATKRAETQERIAFTRDTVLKVGSEYPESTGPLASAMIRGSMDEIAGVIEKAGPGLSAQLTRAQISEAKARGAAARAEAAYVGNLTGASAGGGAAGNVAAQFGMPNPVGMKFGPSGVTLSSLSTPDLLSELDNNILDKDGNIQPGREANLQFVQAEMMNRGTAMVYRRPGFLKGALARITGDQPQRFTSVPLDALTDTWRMYERATDPQEIEKLNALLVSSGLYVMHPSEEGVDPKTGKKTVKLEVRALGSTPKGQEDPNALLSIAATNYALARLAAEKKRGEQ